MFCDIKCTATDSFRFCLLQTKNITRSSTPAISSGCQNMSLWIEVEEDQFLYASSQYSLIQYLQFSVAPPAHPTPITFVCRTCFSSTHIVSSLKNGNVSCLSGEIEVHEGSLHARWRKQWTFTWMNIPINSCLVPSSQLQILSRMFTNGNRGWPSKPFTLLTFQLN